MESSFWLGLLRDPLVDSTTAKTSSKLVSKHQQSIDMRGQANSSGAEGLQRANTITTATSLAMPYDVNAPMTPTYKTLADGQNQLTDPITKRIYSVLADCVNECHLDRFYSVNALNGLAEILTHMLPAVQNLVRNRWMIPSTTISDAMLWDLVKISLFNVCILCDDSAGMVEEERKEDLQACVTYIVELCQVLGIPPPLISFVNSAIEHDSCKSESEVKHLLSRITFNGTNTLGSALKTKIIEKRVRTLQRNNDLHKPVLVVCIAGEPISEGAHQTVSIMESNPTDMVRYSLAQVGTNKELLECLIFISRSVRQCDVTENYDAVTSSLKRNGLDVMAPELWILKLLLGPIDSSYAGLAEDD